jgi:hypothetical protein
MVELIKTMAEQSQLRNTEPRDIKPDVLHVVRQNVDIDVAEVANYVTDSIINELIYVSEDEEDIDDDNEDSEDEEEEEEEEDGELEEDGDPILIPLNIIEDTNVENVIEVDDIDVIECSENNNIKTINLTEFDLSLDYSNSNSKKDISMICVKEDVDEDIITEIVNIDVNDNESYMEKDKIKDDYKKYSITKLREFVLEKKGSSVINDITKLKKNDLLKLLESE